MNTSTFPLTLRPRACILTLCAIAFAFATLHAASPARPNVLFVLSDDHSYPFLSCYGDTNVRTPALDKLAAEDQTEGIRPKGSC